MKQALKIKLENHSQFQQAWDTLIKLGYHCPQDLVPFTAAYLYAYADGLIRPELEKDEAIALNNFNDIENKEITFVDLMSAAKKHEHEKVKSEIIFLNHERPLFEANYAERGGRLQFLKWDECEDGVGTYQADWEAISEADISNPDFDEQIQEHAEHVTSCLHSWVECAKSKAIPDGYFLMPIQPSIEMLKEAELEFNDLDIQDIQDRIVFSHQAMIQVLSKSTQ